MKTTEKYIKTRFDKFMEIAVPIFMGCVLIGIVVLSILLMYYVLCVLIEFNN